MTYNNIREAVFVIRKNRFTAEIQIDGKTQVCHVKNTGRLRELLVPGAICFVEESDNPERKTKYSLIAVKHGDEIINIDSQAPNKVFFEWAKNGCFLSGITQICPEKTFGNSRFDFYIETKNDKVFVEVKGVTLKKDGVALFPDAPTKRGVKHLYELCNCTEKGYKAYVVFVAQMKGVHTFSPNRDTHKEFADALLLCSKKGVNIVCADCNVTESTLNIDKTIDIKLK